ncbi:MAG: GntR family transcriptional regulator [Firmicutes bacterium HGW-Firmicutes-7]|nr:MAG: GntR family transcriptional regulator [Firmicutes bacterium HGW-Firmicutes-7]
MSKRYSVPIYMKIAVDMAGRIYKSEFGHNQKIRGRSSLASEYNVSPETIRRAMRILEDMQIVKVVPSSGIYVASHERAEEFIGRFRARESIYELQGRMHDLDKQKKKIDTEIDGIIKQIIDYSNRLKHSDQIIPLELPIPKKSHFIGKSMADLKVWYYSGATVVGVRRKDQLIVSPGPYEVFQEGDHLLFVGSLECLDRMTIWVNE